MKLDKTDAFFYTGLLMLGGGLFARAPWVAFSVVGSVLLVVSLMGAIRK